MLQTQNFSEQNKSFLNIEHNFQLLCNFAKYQSLGNHFILYDWYKKPNIDIQRIFDTKQWNDFVKNICNKNFGVGADGILILKSTYDFKFPEILIFNSDGTQAELCLNGIRCAAKHIFNFHNIGNRFLIKANTKNIACYVKTQNPRNKHNPEISTTTELGTLNTALSIKVDDYTFNGYRISVGNPHFVIFQECDVTWLKNNGNKIESHAQFSNKTNVEFVWKKQNQDYLSKEKIYNFLVYERGCGMTLSCGSGIAATISIMFISGTIKKNDPVIFKTLGGETSGYVDENHKIVITGNSYLLFNGRLENIFNYL